MNSSTSEDKKMKYTHFITATCFALMFAAPAIAQSSDWKDLSGLAFQSIDADQNGRISPSEFSNFGDDVFVSMDSDASGALSLGEFYNWGFGMHNVAEDAGQAPAFETAMRVVFALWDRDADNRVTAKEYRQSLNFEMMRADLDADKALSEAEYLAGFSIVAAAQAAIHPQPTDN